MYAIPALILLALIALVVFRKKDKFPTIRGVRDTDDNGKNR